MRNEAATPIRKITTAVGVGLAQALLVREGRKGCSPILSTAPAGVLPPFEAVTPTALLRGQSEEALSIPVPDDEPLVTFQLYAGEEDILTLDWQEVFLRSLSAFRGRFAFELIGGSRRVGIHLSMPTAEASGTLIALTGIFPGLRWREVRHPFPVNGETGRLTVEELVPHPPYHRRLSLVGDKKASPLWIAYNTLLRLPEDSLGVYQVLFKPTPSEQNYHANIRRLVDAERRASDLCWMGGLDDDFSYEVGQQVNVDPSAAEKVEVDCSTFAVVWRSFVWADPIGTETFLAGLRAAASVIRFGNKTFSRLGNDQLLAGVGGKVLEKMVRKRLVHRPGLILTSHEVASLFHLPNGFALKMFGGIERRNGVEWKEPPADAIDSLVLGDNTYAGHVVQVRVPTKLRLQHLHTAGTTGSGKSWALRAMTLSDARQGHGFAVIDPHGDLGLDILSYLPEERIEDVIYVNFSEPGLVPRWNFFRAPAPPAKISDDFVRALESVSQSWGVQIEHIVRQAAYTTARLGGNLAEFVQLLSKSREGRELRLKAREVVDHPDVERFWAEEFNPEHGIAVTAVLNKLSPILQNDELGRMFRQRENDLWPREWMDQRRIVIVNLETGRLGETPARFIGGLLVSFLLRSAFARADVPEEARTPFFLYMDECQDLQSGALEEILAEARKYGLGAVFSHQSLGQLKPGLLSALGNCATRLFFRPTDLDVAHVRRALLSRAEEEDLRALGTGEAFAVVGSRVANVKTPSSFGPRLRDGREFVKTLSSARRDSPERQAPPEPRPVRRRRDRIYDEFGGGE